MYAWLLILTIDPFGHGYSTNAVFVESEKECHYYGSAVVAATDTIVNPDNSWTRVHTVDSKYICVPPLGDHE